MDEKVRLSEARSSLGATAFLVAQAARMLVELSPRDYVAPLTAEEEGLYLQQKAILEKLSEALRWWTWWGEGPTDVGVKGLKKLIAECEEISSKLRQEVLERRIAELRSKLNGSHDREKHEEADQRGEVDPEAEKAR